MNSEEEKKDNKVKISEKDSLFVRKFLSILERRPKDKNKDEEYKLTEKEEYFKAGGGLSSILVGILITVYINPIDKLFVGFLIIFVVTSFTCLFCDFISVHKIKLFKRWSKQVNFGAGMVVGFAIATLAVVATSFWYDL